MTTTTIHLKMDGTLKRNFTKTAHTMKRIFTILLLSVFTLTSCTKSNFSNQNVAPTTQFVVNDFPVFKSASRVIGIEDIGKTDWEVGDHLMVTTDSGSATITLSADGVWTPDRSITGLNNNSDIQVTYAPNCELVNNVVTAKAGIQYGTEEYFSTIAQFVDGVVTIAFGDMRRTYSRLRIATEAKQTITVTTTDFYPAGAVWAAQTEPYTLTADEKGNAFLYGTFIEDATISVKVGDITLKDYTFSADKNRGGTEAGKSYALYAGKKEEVDLSTLTGTYTITEDGYYEFTRAGSYGIKVESGNPKIVLNDASITVSTGSAIDVASGNNATIFVLGDNTIGTTKTESWNEPCGGIFVAEGGTVNITSNGTNNILRAHGTLAAAIGGKYVYTEESHNAGNINISNVTVYAYTNNFFAAAIGAAGEGTCGTINITNAVIYAYGAGDRWTSAPGIGRAWDHVGWAETIPVVIISGSEIHTFRYNPYSDYIGYLGDEMGEEGGFHATGSINCGEGGSVKSSTIYCYTGLDATTTDKVVTYDADGNPTEN